MALFQNAILATACLLAAATIQVEGHGRTVDPPQRGSLWRIEEYAWANPGHDRDDQELFCGGRGVTDPYIGACGLCGDSILDPKPRKHEIGGEYERGIITRNYTVGATIPIQIHIDVAHDGWHEFRLCAYSETGVESEECFNRNLLKFGNGLTREDIRGTVPLHTTLILPPGITCDRCVLQTFDDILCKGNKKSVITAEDHKTRYDEIDSLEVYSSDSFSLRNWANYVQDSDCPSFLQTFRTTGLFPPYFFTLYYFRNFLARRTHQLEKMRGFPSREKDLLYHLRNPKTRWFLLKMLENVYESVSNEEVMAWSEEELTKCERSVHINDTSGIDFYLEYLKRHYPSLDFYKGKEDIFPKPHAVIFKTSQYSQVPRVFVGLLEGWIYAKVRTWFARIGLSKARNATQEVKPQGISSIDGNIQTVLIIFCILNLGAVTVLLLEGMITASQFWMTNFHLVFRCLLRSKNGLAKRKVGKQKK